MDASNRMIERAQAWLGAWQDCIRERNYTQARALFDDGITAFGTVKARMSGLDELVREQWRPVWEHTRAFEFDLARCAVVLAGADHCVIALPWSCIALPRGDRPEYQRSGRASIVLRDDAGALRCVHTHFSIDPAPEAFTH